MNPNRKGISSVGENVLEYQISRIELLNQVFGKTELTRAEQKSLQWLSGWEVSTVENFVSAIRKVITTEKKQQIR